ncbi:TetR/AcrR family transcriptional regulator [Nonomuraea basaltis]|uniref:TetR/AcrR family transcriptional regulator n=1 Tax=Nonomuraea basaltis TaxID=2495887 RepID=UPI00110C4FF2|nr:TetR/AcrR family transcriptional regulator [Nonomuraea basaltis]TMR97119.1 TetR/AcrR family transcriptional regulator [Nonomuraea basaltis]
MTIEPVSAAPAQDRRVRRTRSALMRAAVALVSERGTAAVSVSDLAEAADVSRQVLYQQFGDRDTLLLEAALDLTRELLPGVSDVSDVSIRRNRALAAARHFAEHRVFYRAVLTSSCAFALNKALMDLFLPLNRQVILQVHGRRLDPDLSEDLAMFMTGGAAAFINTWVVEGEDPLDPEEFTDRLLRLTPVVIGMRPPTTEHDEEQRP